MSMRPASDPVLVLTGGAPARPLRVRPRHLVAALCVAAAIASVVLFALPSGGGSHAKHAAAGSNTYRAPGFSVSYPAGWRATAAGAGAVAIQRSDRSALVTVRAAAPLKGSLSKLAKGLPRELRKRFPDFQPIGARAVQLSTGPALVYTFARSGKVETMVVAPAAKHSYTLIVVAKPGARQAAAEAGAIVRSLRAG